MQRRIRTLSAAACLAGAAVVLAPIAGSAAAITGESPPGSESEVTVTDQVSGDVVAEELDPGATDTTAGTDPSVGEGSPLDGSTSADGEDEGTTDAGASDGDVEQAVEDELGGPAVAAAVEEPGAFVPLAVVGVDTFDDTADVDPGDGLCADAAGDCSLRAAVQEANALPGADTITLSAGTYGLGLAGAGEDLAATGDLDVIGDLTITGEPGTVIDASALGDRVFDVRPDSALRLSGLVLTGGSAADVSTASGGGVLNNAVLEATDVEIRDSSANRAGGAIEATAGSTTTLLRVTLADNTTGPTPGNGGGFHLTGAGTVTITDSQVTGNTAANEGGGLWNSSVGTMTVSGSTITGNTAAGALATNGGGGIFNQPDTEGTSGGTVVVTDTVIADNAATGAAGSGGGLFNSRGTVTIDGSRFEGNTAPRAGGGIEALAGTTSVSDTDFVDNETGANPGNGGAIHLTGTGQVDIVGGTASGNTAANEGGAFWNSATGTMTITDTEITGNRTDGDAFTAPDFEGGGGVFNDGATTDGVSSGGTLTITGGIIAENQALVGSGSGGGVLNVFGTLTVEGTEIHDNQAARAGGGIEANGGTTTLTGVGLVGNEAGPTPGNGGGLHLTGPGSVDVDQSLVMGNTAANEGGGLWSSAAGTMTVTRSVVVANVADGTAEGSGGGGLYNDGGTLAVSDTVMTGNRAAMGGGVLHPVGGTTTLTHVTVIANEAEMGAGVAATVAGTTLANSIVGENDGPDCSGIIASNGGNVVGTCAIAGPGDVAGVTDLGLDDELVPGADSPALDAGLSANATPADLVGTSRPLDGDGDGEALPDAGALEAPGTTPPTTTPPTTTPTTPGGSGVEGSGVGSGQGGPAPAAAVDGTLPYTGSTAPLMSIVLAALALLGVGTGAVVLQRRRVEAGTR
jgi:CSLREA domain-containing protein